MSQFTAYSERYIENLFNVWYSAGRPSINKLLEHLTEKGVKDEHGRIPSYDQLRDWSGEYAWHDRGDALLAKASAKMEIKLVDKTVEMWDIHADAAREVALKALDHIREHGFDSSASAVQAIKWAQEEERKTRGAKEFITAVKNSSSENLMETIRELMERSSATEDVVDAETKEE